MMKVTVVEKEKGSEDVVLQRQSLFSLSTSKVPYLLLNINAMCDFFSRPNLLN